MNAKNVILVHGAFADASGWQHVIPLLEDDGYTVTAVQNPLSSFQEDVATTKRLIDAQVGPVVVVGHSYGGAVITEAAANNPNVVALVYVAAFAPDAGESVMAASEQFPPSALGTALAPDAAGFVYIDRAKFHDVFAHDLPVSETRIMAATQKPIAGASFGGVITTPAWKTTPVWYIVATEDHAIHPDFQRFLAKRIGAMTTEIHSSHVAFISHPCEIAQIIEVASLAMVAV